MIKLKTIFIRLGFITLLPVAFTPVFSEAENSVEKVKHSKDGLTVKAGFDLPGRIDVPAGSEMVTDDMNGGFSASIDYAIATNGNFSVGGGIGGQLLRTVDSDNLKGSVSFYDGYVLMNYVIPAGFKNFAFYTSLQLGWSVPYADSEFKNNFAAGTSLSGDLYWAAAAGALIADDYLLEIFYKAHHGELENGDAVNEFEYRHFGIAVGYRF